ncbi:hypothetical protein H9P43_008819 [Blastocladiella emersonii ATCC 22665]|nr:hypothetical protein H9P43_008819 [Blastocladiella emersonii ATCC 22665]
MSHIIKLMASLPTGIRARTPASSSTRVAASTVRSKNGAADTTFASTGGKSIIGSSSAGCDPQPLAQVTLADSGIVATTPTSSTERIHDASSGSKSKASARLHAAAAAIRNAAHSTSDAVHHAVHSALSTMRRTTVSVPAAGTRAFSRIHQLCSRRRQPLTGVAGTLDYMARNGDSFARPGVRGMRGAMIKQLVAEHRLGSARIITERQPVWQFESLLRIERYLPASLFDYLGTQLGEFREEEALSPKLINEIAVLLHEHHDVLDFVAWRFDPRNDFSPEPTITRKTLPLPVELAITALDAKVDCLLTDKQRGGMFETPQHAADFRAYVGYMGRMHDAHVEVGREAGPCVAARALASLAGVQLTGFNVYEVRDEWDLTPSAERDAMMVMYYLFALSRLSF